MTDATPPTSTSVLIGINWSDQTVVHEFGALRTLQQRRLAIADDFMTVLLDVELDPPFVDVHVDGAKLCPQCGCSDNLACDDECAWSLVRPGYCSSCTGLGVDGR